METLIQTFEQFVAMPFFMGFSLPFLAAFFGLTRKQNEELSQSWFIRFSYVWSKIVLDISLVWGIALACNDLIGMTLMMKNSDGLSPSIIYIFSHLASAGLAAALAFSLEKESAKAPIRLSIPQVTFVIVWIWGILLYSSSLTGVKYLGGHYHPIITSSQLALICVLTMISSKMSSMPWQQTIFKANLGVTLFLMALGVLSWFLNWSNFENSKQSTWLIANVLMWGCIVHVSFYFIVMATEKQPDAKLRIKTWHFTEAFAFFAFLIYAPIGTTEYYRESADQKALQEQHENQQSEIDSLKAELEDLKEQIKN